jgi:predicted RNA-binding Zn-ribbon protein involved in translation (DUF1610 family)
MKRRPRGKRLLRCPHCLSDRVLMEAAFITGQKYRCEACGYVGPLILESDLPTQAP